MLSAASAKSLRPAAASAAPERRKAVRRDTFMGASCARGASRHARAMARQRQGSVLRGDAYKECAGADSLGYKSLGSPPPIRAANGGEGLGVGGSLLALRQEESPP